MESDLISYKEISILDIYEPIKISKKYTKKDINKNSGDIPVYSSQYLNGGCIGNVNKATFEDCSKNNTYATFGDHTKSVFIREKPFSVADNVKVLKLKDELRGKINEDYVLTLWKSLISDLGYSRHWKVAKKVKFKVPMENDSYNILEQSKLYEKHKKINQILDFIKSTIERIEKVKVELGNGYPSNDIPISKIFIFPSTNSKITKEFCNKNQGKIPVYASSKDENSVLGYIQDNIEGVNYYENCLSWNRNGSVGYVFVRNHRFATNEDHRAMTIKEEYDGKLDKDYLKFEIEKQLLINGFSFVDKCGVEKIKPVLIRVPTTKKGDIDFDKQKEIANKYKKVDFVKKKLNERYMEIKSIKIEI